MAGQDNARKDWLIIGLYYLIWLGSAFIATKTPYLSSYVLAGLYTVMLIAIFWRFEALKQPLNINILKGIGWGLIAWGAVLMTMLGVSLLTKDATLGSSNTGLILTMMRKHWPYIGYIVIVAPLIEEIVFRQCLYRRLDNWMARHWPGMMPKAQFLVAAMIVALFFGMMHGDTSSLEYVLISLLLQVLYRHYGDLRVNMAAHVTFNLATLIALLFI